MRITLAPHGWRSAGLAAIALLALAAVAYAAAGGGDPRQPTRSNSPLVSIGQPIAPYRAGRPATGWIELRARDLGGPGDVAVLYHEHAQVRRGRAQRQTCAEVGPEQRLRRYPVRDGGSCQPAGPGAATSPLGFGVGTTGRRTWLHGQATADVRRLVVAGPGGTYAVPLSRHRAFLVVYGARARGTVSLTAHLRDGSTRFFTTPLPPEMPSRPGSVSARDPGGRPAWTVTASLRETGARRGQTCAQFTSSGFARRVTLEAGAPMCGDLSRALVFADATRYGPRPAGSPFSPGPRSPRRLIVWGAVAPSVRGVRVVGPGAPRRLALSPLGRAFITVYPAAVTPQQITLELTRADGSVERHVAPRRLNAVGLVDQPRLAGPIGLRERRGDPSRLVLSATLTRPAKRFEITLAGREVPMRRSGGTTGMVRYVGVYDRDRGVRRTFVAGRRYEVSVVLCGPQACSTRGARVRLR